MRTIIAALIASACMFGQAPDPTPVVEKAAYVLIGGAYNQFTGTSAFLSAILPETANVFGSVTADLFPQKYRDPKTGKTGHVISASTRFGQHRVVFRAKKFTGLFGGDIGPTFSQEPGGTGVAIGGTNVGFSGSFTATAVWMFSEHVGVSVPIRALYVSGAGPNGQGAWNPVVEVALTLKR